VTKYVCMRALATLVLSAGVYACTASKVGGDSEEPSGLPGDGEALSAEALQIITAAPDFAANRDLLERSGSVVMLDHGRAYRDGVRFAAVFPIQSTSSTPAEYKDLIYQTTDGHASVSLELAEPGQDEMGELTAEPVGTPELMPQGYTCGGWGAWYTISTFCDDSAMCWWNDATFWVRRHARKCCATTCFTQTQDTTVRHACGC